MTLGELAGYAYTLASYGIPVFPCAVNKIPCTKRGYLDATTDPDVVRQMFLNARNAALISMVTGSQTEIVVIDVDPQGLPWFRGRITKFTETRIDETPRKGLHLLYRYPGTNVRNSAGKIAKGIDVRGEGGSCIIPPSPGYTTIHDVELAPLPDWIVRKLTRKPKMEKIEAGGGNAEALAKFVSASKEGERNARLYWAARKASPADGKLLLGAALQCGLTQREAAATIRSGFRAH